MISSAQRQESIKLGNSQERQEDNGLDAEELGQRSHAVHILVVGAIEEDEAVHRHHLTHVGHQRQIGIRDV